MRYNQKTKEQFVEEANLAHSGKYDYSHFIYTNARTKSVIICPEHGCFEQTPDSHLRGKIGCRNCRAVLSSKSRSKTTETFVAEAIVQHKNKYTYSRTNYKNAKSKVTIICPIHGEFTQTPDSHLRGNGCPDCGEVLRRKSSTHTTELFIQKANIKHGDAYDYSQVNYKKSTEEVEIICSEHGSFWITPHRHLTKRENRGGCPKCGINLRIEPKRSNTDDFIEKSIQIHGFKYDYKKVNYHNAHDPVEIICNEHGSFYQAPTGHLRGSGCPKCGDLSTSEKQRFDLSDLLDRFYSLHSNKYDYPYIEDEYKNQDSVLTIKCPTHGIFQQVVASHVFGYGCKQCGYESAFEKQRMSTEDFIRKAKSVHGYLYDYSQSICLGSKEKITIICSKHGKFEQIAQYHLAGCGCQTCNESRGERLVAKALMCLGYKFKQQARFKSCRHKKSLPFDFLVKIENRLGFLLEFQGQHHYEPVKRGSSMSDMDAMRALKGVQKRDGIKKQWCEKNNIPFLVIPYWKSGDIDNLIRDFSFNLMKKRVV